MESILGSLTQFLHWIPTILAVVLGNYVNKRFNNSSSQLVFIGSLIGLIVAAGYLLMRFSSGAMNMDISTIYFALSFIGFAGRMMFILGLLQLVKIVILPHEHEPKDYNDIIKPL